MAQRTGIAVLRSYFGYRQGESLKDFAREVKALTDTDFEQLRDGIADGSLTY